MSIYFIGDTHFYGENIGLISNRPFDDIDHMNSEIINAINCRVAKSDILYIVGDFADTTDRNYIENILDILHGEIHIIEGNHDIVNREIYRELLGWKYHETDIILDDFWMVSHYPKYVSMNTPYANIFAHVHNNPIYKRISPRSFCVSADMNDFTPISFDEIKQMVHEATE